MTPAELRALAGEHERWSRDSGDPSPLWLMAHAANDASRDDMWEWLEERYVQLALLCAEMVDAMMGLYDDCVRSGHPWIADVLASLEALEKP